MHRLFVLTLLALTVAACQTTFTGDPHFPGGPGACVEKCAQSNMEMGAFIYAGEFSSACVCEPKGKPREQRTSVAETSSLVGVMTQMRNQRTTHAGPR